MQHFSFLKPVALVGMMGVGKTSLGLNFARLTGVPFYDSDHALEERTGCSVREIFQYSGEARFRQMEYNTIVDLLDSTPCPLVSLGGGAFVQDQTRAHVLDHAYTIWLDVPLDQLIPRLLANKAGRPLLDGDNPEQAIRDMAANRARYYQQAHYRFCLDQLTLPMAKKMLMQHLIDNNILQTL